ncbi:ankyrin-1-like [Trichogramma pretiosum]|uniref:ankyrin-1-like n=1 Tax=Trichogramma pretiosum TaxID=7493 RepID=UPI0006C9D590|nr:ankyrin-1-like [Trichogramma pretiosum]
MPRRKNLYMDPYPSLLSSMKEADYDERLEILKRFRLDHIKEDRCEIIARFPGLYKQLQGPVPKLPAIFDNRELDQLLFEATDTFAGYSVTHTALQFVSLVVQSGYRYEPEHDDEGRPRAEHATPLHLVVLHSPSHFKPGWFELSDDLFRIYERHEVNYRDEHGLTLLHVASHFGYDRRVRRYLELGADPNCREGKTGNAPLHAALANGLKSTVKLLLNYGADPSMANAQGATPLHVALANSQKSNVKLLLENGADPSMANAEGATPLHVLGLIHNRANLAEMLNKLGKHGPVHVDAQDNEGNSPLHLAVGSDNQNMMVYLLKRGANPNLVNNRRLTPLHLVCRRHNGSTLKLFFKTIDELRQESAPQKGKRSASRRRRVDVVVYQEMNVNVRDESGRTPLQLAVANCRPQAVDLLLEHGADLADFAFPTSDYFGASFEPDRTLRMASGALASCECLEKAGYTLTRDDAVTIMKFFDGCGGMFASKEILDRRWYDDDAQLRTWGKSIKPKWLPDEMTLEDLVMLPFELADQRMEYDHYHSLSLEGLYYFVVSRSSPCNEYLCEQLARGFFRRWALHPFMELIHDRLPQLCCEMILEHLTNRDLCNVCLAVAAESSPVTQPHGEQREPPPPPRQEEEARSSEPPSPPARKRRSKKLKT